MRLPLLLLLIAVAVPHWAATAGDSASPGQEDATQDSYVVIVGSYRDFHEAHRRAKVISQVTSVPFSLRDMLYDTKRGLIFRDDFPDEIYAGSYVSRRYNTTRLSSSNEDVEYLSIERSDAYSGFRKGYFIIVAGIYGEQKDARAKAKQLSSAVSDAYAKKTRIYYGCMH